MASSYSAPVSPSATAPAAETLAKSASEAASGLGTAVAPALPAGNATTPVADSLGSVAPKAGAAADAAQSAAAALPPGIAESTFSWSGYFQAIAILLLLMGVLWVGVWLARKYGKFNFMPQPGAFPRDSLRVEAQVPLGPRKGLVVVRFLNKRILLGVTDQQITYLTEAGNHDEQKSTDFQDLMDAAQCQKSDG